MVTPIDGVEVGCDFGFAFLAAAADRFVIHGGQFLVPGFEIIGAFVSDARLGMFVTLFVRSEVVQSFAEAFELWLEVWFGFVYEVIERADRDFKRATLPLDLINTVLQADCNGIALMVGRGRASGQA